MPSVRWRPYEQLNEVIQSPSFERSTVLSPRQGSCDDYTVYYKYDLGPSRSLLGYLGFRRIFRLLYFDYYSPMGGRLPDRVSGHQSCEPRGHTD